MAIPIPGPLIEFILLGPLDDRRQLQDSPILGDVWVEFGKQPAERRDLLIAPYRGQHAGSVAATIDEGLGSDLEDDRANIAFLQGLVVARLTFEEVVRILVPKTKWWISKWTKDDDEEDDQRPRSPKTRSASDHMVMKYVPDTPEVLDQILKAAKSWQSKSATERLQELPSLKRFWALTGLILWAGNSEEDVSLATTEEQIATVLERATSNVTQITSLLASLAEGMAKDFTPEPLVWQISLNRQAMPALNKSIPAVKADAATTLFKVNCSQIGWAVIDSGIEGSHPAFLDENGKSRVKRSFDFKDFRKIVSLSNSKPAIRKKNLDSLMKNKELLVYSWADEQEADDALKRLADDARKRGPVHWELVEKFVEIKPAIPETKPQTNHGTHVAGIIGASKKSARAAVERAAAAKAEQKAAARKAAAEKAALEAGAAPAAETIPGDPPKIVIRDNPDFADGMCPDIMLYDFRVLGPEIKDTEFAIIAALQFIRYLNDRDNFFTIHGANLSLSIPHDVRNFACGRTPICEECERLVASGVVVVAAAGNHGYKSFETKEGSYDSYAAFSITDPGNADNVLTVGATHRFWPHTYGVSFFSSRGPTGDGRLKPDLVAPGERIRAPLAGGKNEKGGEWGDLDGTSMAAPHVSGAAAMLMARYSELVGQPLRVKRIICESATDLARERSFQGHGMLDVLRAFQSI